jgi:hypothetical protein
MDCVHDGRQHTDRMGMKLTGQAIGLLRPPKLLFLPDRKVKFMYIICARLFPLQVILVYQKSHSYEHTNETSGSIRVGNFL